MSSISLKPSKEMANLTSVLCDGEVQLKNVESPWRPYSSKKSNSSEECKTQELYMKFKSILNKITPQTFNLLFEQVKTLEINNQTRLEGVVDLIFEKAIKEPDFSEVYAVMCNKFSQIKVPCDNAPDQYINFRALIISKCQVQFVACIDENLVLNFEKVKNKQLQLMCEEVKCCGKKRSLGNMKFIGELYKLKCLTAKIMVYCMNGLIDKIKSSNREDMLECLCILLATIGEQVESEVKDNVDCVFNKLQEVIVHHKNNKLSGRIRFLIQDIIELRERKWIRKASIDQIQMISGQRHIQVMNTSPLNFGREEGGREKRGNTCRQNSNALWKTSNSRYTVDTSKLKASTRKNLNTIKLLPPSWNHGFAAETGRPQRTDSMIGIKNMYSVLEDHLTDHTISKGTKSKRTIPSYNYQGESIERSTFNSRGDFYGSGRSRSAGVVRSNWRSQSTSGSPTPLTAAKAPVVPVWQQPLPVDQKGSLTEAVLGLCLMNPDDDEFVSEFKILFPPKYHAAVVTEIFYIACERSAKEMSMIANLLLHAVSAKTITIDNFLLGLTLSLEFASDMYIDLPLLDEYLAKFIVPQIKKEHITLAQVHALSQTIISHKRGHSLLKALIRDLREDMGSIFVKTKWQESGLQLTQWMSDDQVASWIVDNKFEFLEDDVKVDEETRKILTPDETQKKLLQLLNSDENCEFLKGLVQDNLSKSSNGDLSMQLIQAICEYALFGSVGRDVAKQ